MKVCERDNDQPVSAGFPDDPNPNNHDLHSVPNDDNRIGRITCAECGNSNYKKSGTIKIESECYQRYRCKDCIYRFHLGIVSEKEKMSIACEYMELYNNGYTKEKARKKINREHDTKYDIKTLDVYKEKALNYLRIQAEDIRCNLYDKEYGLEWKVDESELPSKYKRKEMKTQKPPRKVCTAVLEPKHNVVIAEILTDSRPDNTGFAKLFRYARAAAGTPKVIITDKYAAYNLAVTEVFGDKVEHKTVKSKTSNIEDGKTIHNAEIESFWNVLKSTMRRCATYGSGLKSYTEMFMIRHNCITLHRSRKRKGEFISTMAAGFPVGYDDFKEMFEYALKNPRTFILQLGELREYVDIRSDDTGFIVRIKDKYKHHPKINFKFKRIDYKLRNCWFSWSEDDKCWTSIDLYGSRGVIPEDRSKNRPAKTFEVCEDCDRVAVTAREVEEYFGYVLSESRLVPNPICKKCKARMPQIIYQKSLPKTRTKKAPSETGRQTNLFEYDDQTESSEMTGVTDGMRHVSVPDYQDMASMNGLIMERPSMNGAGISLDEPSKVAGLPDLIKDEFAPDQTHVPGHPNMIEDSLSVCAITIFLRIRIRLISSVKKTASDNHDRAQRSV